MSGFSPPGLKVKVLQVTRDLTLATGSVAYTGVGFKPKGCIASGTVSGTALTQYTNIFGATDTALAAFSDYILASQTGVGSTLVTFTDTTAANSQSANVASFDVDGMTLSWTKTGTPTGIATINLIFFG